MKPSGVKWHGCQTVTFHDKKDAMEISRSVMDLLSQLEPHDGVLVEDFHVPSTIGKSAQVFKFKLASTVKLWNI